MLTPEQTTRKAELTAFLERWEVAWKKYATFDRKGGSSATAEQLAAIKEEAGDFTNELRSELEILRFLSEPSGPYFGYPSGDEKRITNFMAATLAFVDWLGARYRGGFQGNYRREFRATGINGVRYYGTMYGTYARMRPFGKRNKK